MDISYNDFYIQLLPYTLFLLGILVACRWYKHRMLARLLIEFLFGFYIIIAVNQVFFPIEIIGSLGKSSSDMSFWNDINLIPFSQVHVYNYTAWIEGFLLNILLTVPFGFGISFISRVKPWHKILGIALAVGLCTELGQLLLNQLVSFHRVVDVNDTICNAIGVLIGYFVFRLVGIFYLKFGFQKIYILAYFSDIFKNA